MSIAIVGASADQRKFGGRLVDYLLRFKYRGSVFPVNIRETHIAGLRCYPNLADIPRVPDLVVVAVPASEVLAAIEDSVAASAKSAIVLSSGFSEKGDPGRALQHKLKEIAQHNNIPVVGPNCQGLANLHTGAIANFATALKREHIVKGGIAILAQSGMTGATIFDHLQDRGVGCGYLVATGNQAVTSTEHIALGILELELASERPLEAIVLAIEGIADGEVLAELAKRAASHHIPLVVIKAGRSQAGEQAIASHTASIAVDDKVFDSFCETYGIIRVRTMRAAAQVAEACTTAVRTAAGARSAIVTNSGGVAALIADDIVASGLQVPSFSPVTERAIGPLLPLVIADAQNPLDVGALPLSQGPKPFGRALQAVAEDPNVDQVHVILGFHPYDVPDIASEFVGAQAKSGKPFIISWSHGETAEARSILRNGNVLTVSDPSEGVQVVARLSDWVRRTRVPTARALRLRRSGHRSSSEMPSGPATDIRDWAVPWSATVHSTLVAGGLSILECRPVHSSEHALQVASRIGYPIALKLGCLARPHKREVGGLYLSLNNEESVRTAYFELASLFDAPTDVILAQKMAPGSGAEVMIALKRDRHFGWVTVLATGGTLVGSWKDEQILVGQLDWDSVSSACGCLVAATLLEEPPTEPTLDALQTAVVGVSRLASVFPDVVNVFEINPLIVGRDRRWSYAADWRFDLDVDLAAFH